MLQRLTIVLRDELSHVLLAQLVLKSRMEIHGAPRVGIEDSLHLIDPFLFQDFELPQKVLILGKDSGLDVRELIIQLFYLDVEIVFRVSVNCVTINI